jgi:hypothetical protein
MSSRRFHVYVEQDKESELFAARSLEISVFSQGKTEDKLTLPRDTGAYSSRSQVNNANRRDLER